MEQFIDAGALNKRVTIQKRAKTSGFFADPLPDTWENLCTVWASINNVGAREFWEAQAAHGELTHKITIRYRRGITADMRVLYGDRVFDVAAPPVDYDMRHKYLVLKCREVDETMYTPHTVTIYNIREDPATLAREIYITVLPGVMFDGNQRMKSSMGKLAGTGTASLWIPCSVEARDGLSGSPRAYAGPREYANAKDRSQLWTLDANMDFFVAGEVIEAEGDFQSIHEAYDDVYRITKAELKNSGAKELWHIEVEGK